jgi:hypothetical protein
MERAWHPSEIGDSLNMESVNMTCDSTLGIIENVPLNFGMGPMYFQVQVTVRTNFDVLLGLPFFKLTSCRMFNLPDGKQDILLTDPNVQKELCIPTLPWVKRSPPKESKHAVMRSQGRGGFLIVNDLRSTHCMLLRWHL